MKRFVFRLDRVLGIRRFELERARLALIEAEAQAARLATALDTAERRLAQGRRLLDEEAAAGCEGPRLALRALAVRAGRVKSSLARQAVMDFEPARAAAREGVRRCRARVESLERLRERRAELHRTRALAGEQAELEDLSMARFGRSFLLIMLACVWLADPARSVAETPAPAPAAKAEAAPDAEAAGGGGKSGAGGAKTSGAKAAEGGLPEAAAALLAGPGFSKGVDLILAEVQTRELALARRELELSEREAAVKELEEMVAGRAGELEKIRAEVETRILAWSSQGQDRIEQLSGVYSVMPPAEAAGLLAKLDLDLAVSVIRQMKKKVSANVLAAMRPERALLVSRRILQPLDPATDAPAATDY